MKVKIIASLYIFFCPQLFITKIQAKDNCPYVGSNGTSYAACDDTCCTSLAQSMSAACCSSVTLSTLAIPFFIIAGVCILGVCVLYCRPLWKTCLCGYKCPCENRSRVNTPRPTPSNTNPVFVLDNDDLPDYETTTKTPYTKDVTPPPYNFVTTHPHDFGIEGRVPSAPPQYSSRRTSAATIQPNDPVNC